MFAAAILFARYLTEPLFRLVGRAASSEVYTATALFLALAARLGDRGHWLVANARSVSRRNGCSRFALSHHGADRDLGFSRSATQLLLHLPRPVDRHGDPCTWLGRRSCHDGWADRAQMRAKCRCWPRQSMVCPRIGPTGLSAWPRQRVRPRAVRATRLGGACRTVFAGLS